MPRTRWQTATTGRELNSARAEDGNDVPDTLGCVEKVAEKGGSELKHRRYRRGHTSEGLVWKGSDVEVEKRTKKNTDLFPSIALALARSRARTNQLRSPLSLETSPNDKSFSL